MSKPGSHIVVRRRQAWDIGYFERLVGRRITIHPSYTARLLAAIEDDEQVELFVDAIEEAER